MHRVVTLANPLKSGRHRPGPADGGWVWGRRLAGLECFRVKREIRFVLHRPKRPENVGAAARALANTGAGTLWVVAPQHWDEEAVAKVATRGARPSLDRLRRVETLTEALTGCIDVVM